MTIWKPIAYKSEANETIYNEENSVYNNWNQGGIKMNKEPPPTILIKSKNDDKSNKDFAKIKLYRDIT